LVVADHHIPELGWLGNFKGTPCPDIQCQFLQAAINILDKILEQRLSKGHYPMWERYVRDCTFDADRFLNLR
jgi:hypothetical protein